ncbi:MAG: transcriptional repressor [Dehalococcoidia bacterium]|jgi:Fur family peroxide stress response transcriptional regulator|nr:transcriptional repressor [Dehalococcoidia bacterium]MDW8008609.1 Fur family transcriptional regulator [Chloroflexota bacterium]
MTTKVQREAIVQELRRRGIRVTAQRVAVAEAILGTAEHLTVQEIYQRVCRHLPHITMGTIYNTLEVLMAKGLIQPLPFPGGTRYDTDPTPHVNVLCIRCGQVCDLHDDGGYLERLAELASQRTGFQPLSQQVAIYALCPSCRPR